MISNTTVVTVNVASVDLYQFYQGKGGTNTWPQFSTALFFSFFLYGTFWHLFYSWPSTLLLSISCKFNNLFFPPNLPLSLSSASSLYLCGLYRGNKLLAIPVTDTALIKYSSALSPPSLFSHSHSAFSFS